jgi:hypothetical protein
MMNRNPSSLILFSFLPFASCKGEFNYTHLLKTKQGGLLFAAGIGTMGEIRIGTTRQKGR